MAAKTIVISSKYGRRDMTRVANVATITPGNLIEIMSTGKLRNHNAAIGPALARFAIEDDEQGNDIDDVYAASVLVKEIVALPGDTIRARLANGATAVIGTRLVSNGAGLLQAYAAEVVTSNAPETINDHTIVGEALEALDLSDSSGADPASDRLNIQIW